jgi:hypothetical protein
MLQGARKENILYGYSTDEQRGSIPKDRQPGGLNVYGGFNPFPLGWLKDSLAG